MKHFFFFFGTEKTIFFHHKHAHTGIFFFIFSDNFMQKFFFKLQFVITTNMKETKQNKKKHLFNLELLIIINCNLYLMLAKLATKCFVFFFKINNLSLSHSYFLFMENKIQSIVNQIMKLSLIWMNFMDWIESRK